MVLMLGPIPLPRISNDIVGEEFKNFDTKISKTFTFYENEESKEHKNE